MHLLCLSVETLKLQLFTNLFYLNRQKAPVITEGDVSSRRRVPHKRFNGEMNGGKRRVFDAPSFFNKCLLECLRPVKDVKC